MDLGFTTSYLSIRFGVQIGSILRWEKGLTNPPIRYLPVIYEFLGYAPYRPVRTLADRLKAWRERLGMTQGQLAKAIGTEESVIGDWEARRRSPQKESRDRLERFVRNHKTTPNFPIRDSMTRTYEETRGL